MAILLAQMRDVGLRIIIDADVLGGSPVPASDFLESAVEQVTAQEGFVKYHLVKVILIALSADDQANQAAEAIGQAALVVDRGTCSEIRH